MLSKADPGRVCICNESTQRYHATDIIIWNFGNTDLVEFKIDIGHRGDNLVKDWKNIYHVVVQI